ncbi:hypothetical protein L798_05174 [Zootermopsis nevadensis]|uniref:Uncharacterized protein n=1 Tax=Zootermopsis nevadensis TaxID=136037 RepID=A0A067RAI7_ZOONE|nr:hypothetical protein L798_05174 [Zootermopsis nevadensis]
MLPTVYFPRVPSSSSEFLTSIYPLPNPHRCYEFIQWNHDSIYITTTNFTKMLYAEDRGLVHW